VLPVTLPGLTHGSSPAGLRLSDAVDHVVREVTDRDLRDIVLVSHSWGGYPATGAAHVLADRVRHVLYCSAVVPERGVSMADENEAYAAVLRESIAASPDGTAALSLEAIRYGLMPAESEELQELVFGLALPQPGGYMTDALDVPPVTDAGLEASYVLGAEDTSLARPGAEFAARIGAEPRMVPGGHMALLNHPKEVAVAVMDAV
jgi:pimeloyl-ACP methyl ester carboxylesterase